MDSGRQRRATNNDQVVAWPDDLLSTGDLTCIAIAELTDLAARMKRDPAAWRDALGDQTLACFFAPSASGAPVLAGTAADRLGMLPVILPVDELRLDGDEPIDDVVHALAGAAAALVFHMVRHEKLRRIAAAATAPVINAVSDDHRPCQALADLLTLRERFGSLEGLAVAFVGDAGTAVAHSLMEAGALAGMDVRVACPPDHGPSPLVRAGAEIFAALHGGRVTVTVDPREAVKGADAVCTAAWGPPGHEAERDGRLPRLREYQVNHDLMSLAKRGAVFMHSLPARRGEEVTAGVIDGPRSLVWEQAANRVPIEQAVIYALVAGGGSGDSAATGPSSTNTWAARSGSR